MQVRVYATLRSIVGGATVPTEVKPGQTVGDLVTEMTTRWPDLRPEMVDDQGNLLGRIQIFINGRNIRHLNNTDTVLPENGNIAIFPPVGGGRPC